MADFIIKDALIADGTGKDRFTGDILIADGLILDLGAGLARGAEGQRIDASGLIASPGFIDTHTHSDCSLLNHPQSYSSLYQGITTEVIGNCGLSCFPVDPEREDLLADYLTGLGHDGSEPLAWTDLAGYADRLERSGLPLDLVPLVGHGSIRIAVMGYEAREATPRELARMDRLLEQALDQGAFGMSSGLVYPPGINAPPKELEHLVRTVARKEAVYTTHLRGDTVRAAPSLVDSLLEALEAARNTGARLHVAHLPAKFPNQGATGRIIELLEEALDQGLEISCDGHPYLAAMTHLASHLPSWIFEGGTGETLRRLTQPVARERVREALGEIFGHLDQEVFWGLNEPVLSEPVLSEPVLSEPVIPNREGGQSLLDLASKMGVSPAEALMDILAQAGEGLFKVMVLLWVYTARESEQQLLWPGATIGGDGLAWSLDQPATGLAAHPRTWGSFATVLADYWRDRNLIGLEELIRKMTSLPARIFGLTDRGVLAPGKRADLILFDPEAVADRSTFRKPAYAAGMRDIFLHGRRVMADGSTTGELAGRVLRRD